MKLLRQLLSIKTGTFSIHTKRMNRSKLQFQNYTKSSNYFNESLSVCMKFIERHYLLSCAF